jgi:signal transduction histidine kinase
MNHFIQLPSGYEQMQFFGMTNRAPDDELKRLQDALNVSEARLSELAENIEDVFYSRNATTGELFYISPACEGLTGRDLQSFYDKPGRFLATVHPDDLTAVKAAAEATLGGLKTQIECRLIKPGGEIVWVSHYAHLVGDRVLGTLRDITARKLADAKLARSTRALKLLSQSNRALTRMEDELQLLGEICRLAVEVGGYRMAWVGYARNDAYRSVEPMAHAGHEAGYLRSLRLSWAEEPAGTPGSACDAIRRNEVCESSDLQDEPSDFPPAQQALARGYGSVLALPLRLGGQTLGVLVLYSVEAQAARIEEISLLQELTDNLSFGIENIRSRLWRTRMEKAVEQVAAGVSVQGGGNFFEMLVRNMSDAMGANGAFVARVLPGDPLLGRSVAAVVNGQMLPQFDYAIALAPCRELAHSASPSLILPENVQALYPEAQLSAFGTQAYAGHRLENSEGQLAGVLALLFREPLKQSQMALLHSTLQIFASRASAELERLQADMEIRHLNASLEDRVQQRTAELKLANQELESFCYSVSHDLRSPLSAVDGFAGLLEMSLESLPESQIGKSLHFLQRIRSGVVQMGELIDALLSLARLSREPLRREQVDLSALAAELLQSCRERDPARVLESHIEPGLLATGDHRLLRQLLDNLLGNAWKFSAGQPVTRISFAAEPQANGQPVYVVRDNGAGFNMAHAEKLFGPFQRLHSPSQFEGTGIGLATVQRIVSRHGGRVWGESVVGEGATFRFTLGTDEADKPEPGDLKA